MATAESQFVCLTPLIPAGGDLAKAVAFYTAELGFEIVWQSDAMAGIRRGAASFNLVVNTDRAWADNTSFSIGVTNLDGLFEAYRQVAAIVGPLELKAWGRREFHIIVPSGVCLQFYDTAD